MDLLAPGDTVRHPLSGLAAHGPPDAETFAAEEERARPKDRVEPPPKDFVEVERPKDFIDFVEPGLGRPKDFVDIVEPERGRPKDFVDIVEPERGRPKDFVDFVDYVDPERGPKDFVDFVDVVEPERGRPKDFVDFVEPREE